MPDEENKPIASPMQFKDVGRVISMAELDQVKKLLGVECLFIVIQNKIHLDCKQEECLGHRFTAQSIGFHPDEIKKICGTIYTTNPKFEGKAPEGELPK